MKLLVALGLIVGAYTYMLLQTTDTVLNQTAQLNATYQYVADNSEHIATGQ